MNSLVRLIKIVLMSPIFIYLFFISVVGGIITIVSFESEVRD